MAETNRSTAQMCRSTVLKTAPAIGQDWLPEGSVPTPLCERRRCVLFICFAGKDGQEVATRLIDGDQRQEPVALRGLIQPLAEGKHD